MVYLDNAATTEVKKEVIDAMLPYFSYKWYNPSSLYGKSVKIKQDIENARNTMANHIGAMSNEIFFTSGGSEGNCWAIQGFVDYWNSKGVSPCIITTTIEHKSIISCIDNLYNADVHYVNVNEDGLVDLQKLNTLLIYNRAFTFNNATLVSVQFANNEIGVIQPIKKIAELAHRYGAVFHTDAVQSFGKMPINVNEFGIDMMTVSGHKIGAPKGIGFLYKNKNIHINPIIYGSQMDGMRGGTENVPYIIGMNSAVELCETDRNAYIELFEKRNYFVDLLKSEFGCKLNGSSKCRLNNNINVTFPQDITGESLLYMLDMSDIAISTGSACNSQSIEPSYVLKAIGLSDVDAMKTIRFTLPDNITYEDIDYVIHEIGKCIKLIEA